MLLALDGDALNPAGPWLFYPFAALAVAGAVGVVLSQQIVRMAVFLLIALSSVAMLYFMLAAEFLAAIQLIVYVGGVLILIIFGVMLTSKNPFARLEVPMSQRLLGAGIGAVAAGFMVMMGGVVISQSGIVADSMQGVGEYGVRELGESLMTKYVLPFELAAVLLLVVMIGAAYIAKGRFDPKDDRDGEGA